MPGGEQLASATPGQRAVRVSSREKGDLIMLGIGGFTPLEGFMTRADWAGVCDRYRTAAGIFWPIPITLSVDAVIAATIRVGDDVALADPDDDDLLAVMKVTEKYGIDKAHECLTTDLEHPGVKMVMQQGDVNLAGPVQKIDLTFWCYACGGRASGRTCAHGDKDRPQISGTTLRRWLSEGSPVPPEFSRPEVLQILREHYAGLANDGKVDVKLAGHSAR